MHVPSVWNSIFKWVFFVILICGLVMMEATIYAHKILAYNSLGWLCSTNDGLPVANYENVGLFEKDLLISTYADEIVVISLTLWTFTYFCCSFLSFSLSVYSVFKCAQTRQSEWNWMSEKRELMLNAQQFSIS